MIERNDILRAMEGRINGSYPGEAVYWDRLPQGFTPPAFTLELARIGTSEVNIGLVRKTAEVLITCYVKPNAFHDSSREELNQRQERIADLFSACLTVGGRVLTPRAEKGMGDPDSPDVTVTFQWTDVRPGYHDPEDPGDPETAQTPKMEHIEINNQYNKEERT